MASAQELIDAANTRVAQAISDADGFINTLSHLSGSYGSWGFYSDIKRQIVPSPEQVDVAAKPELGKAEVNDAGIYDRWLSDIGDLMSGTIPVIDARVLPEFDQNPHPLNLPDRPEFNLPSKPPSFDVGSVSVNVGDDPTVKTDLVLDEAPIPDPDVIAIPTFDLAAPELDYLAPSNEFSFVEQSYSSDLKDTIIRLIKADLEDGGSGINPDDERLLWERARDREAAAFARAGTAVADEFAARGFDLPSVTMAGLMQQAQAQFLKAIGDVNRDIALKRSELYLQARQFAVSQGIQIETALLSYHGQVMERALNAAKIVADLGIRYFNAKAQRFNDKLKLWATTSEVYSQWVDNALKKTKEYELKLAKAEAQDRRNARRIELMNAMNRAASILDDIRKTKLAAGNFQIENERLKLQQAREMTERYVAEIRGNEAAFRAFAEAVKAETLRNEDFRLNLEAYKGRLEGERIRAQIDEVRQRSYAENERIKLQRLQAKLQGYVKELDAAIAKARQIAENNKIDLSGWEIAMRGQEVNAKLKLQAAIEQIKANLEVNRVDHDRLRASTQFFQEIDQVKVKAAEAGIHLYENLIAAAQSALTSVVTLTESSVAP